MYLCMWVKTYLVGMRDVVLGLQHQFDAREYQRGVPPIAFSKLPAYACCIGRVIPYDLSYHVMSYHVMSCHVMSCHVMSCHAMPCRVMSCHVLSCHVMCSRAINEIVWFACVRMYIISMLVCMVHMQTCIHVQLGGVIVMREPLCAVCA
jgi:hypothetical protein